MLHESLVVFGENLHFRGDCSVVRQTRVGDFESVLPAGGSQRDVQQLVGHANLNTTMGYIDGSSDAKRRVVDMR